MIKISGAGGLVSKAGFSALLEATGIERFARAVRPARGIILAMHRVSKECPSGPLGGLTVSVEDFSACVELLRSRGFEVVTMSEAVARMSVEDHGPPFAVLTFDDGYVDNHDLLLPLCERLSLPAVVYVTTGFVDRTHPMWWYGLEDLFDLHASIQCGEHHFERFEHLHRHVLGLPPGDAMQFVDCLQRDYRIDFGDVTDRHAMTWPMVRDLAASGWVEVGAHGVSHAALARLAPDAADQEIRVSGERLEQELGLPTAHFAYPYGDRTSVGPREVRSAHAAGYASSVTSIAGMVRTGSADRWALRRVVLGGPGMVDRLRFALLGLTGQRPIAGPT